MAFVDCRLLLYHQLSEWNFEVVVMFAFRDHVAPVEMSSINCLLLTFASFYNFVEIRCPDPTVNIHFDGT